MNDDLHQITSSLQLLDEDKSENLLSLTYSTFFEACQDAESLWEKDDPDSRGKMFNGIILTIMDNLTRPEICENNLASDVKDHDEYGVNKGMYGLFFTSLLEALRATLGENFNQEMQQAWKRQLEQLEGLAHKHTCR
jgi:hemoglobin-like flavoprotein